MKLPSKLPSPDEFGNHWFGNRTTGVNRERALDPAILKSANGGFIVSFGDEMLFGSRNELERIESADKAFSVIRARLRAKR